MKLITRREIIYSESSHGNVIINYSRDNDNDNKYEIGSMIHASIIPDKGYMRGLITLVEESALKEIPYKLISLNVNNDEEFADHENCDFIMPNDNVKLFVKFVKKFNA